MGREPGAHPAACPARWPPRRTARRSCAGCACADSHRHRCPACAGTVRDCLGKGHICFTMSDEKACGAHICPESNASAPWVWCSAAMVPFGRLGLFLKLILSPEADITSLRSLVRSWHHSASRSSVNTRHWRSLCAPNAHWEEHIYESMLHCRSATAGCLRIYDLPKAESNLKGFERRAGGFACMQLRHASHKLQLARGLGRPDWPLDLWQASRTHRQQLRNNEWVRVGVHNHMQICSYPGMYTRAYNCATASW